jgi:hypothetical protein
LTSLRLRDPRDPKKGIWKRPGPLDMADGVRGKSLAINIIINIREMREMRMERDENGEK